MAMPGALPIPTLLTGFGTVHGMGHKHAIHNVLLADGGLVHAHGHHASSYVIQYKHVQAFAIPLSLDLIAICPYVTNYLPDYGHTMEQTNTKDRV
jgi:hypothetical protein